MSASAKKAGPSATVSIRLPAADIRRLDALVERLPYAKRSAVGREALLRGLAAIERETSKRKRSTS